MADTLRDRIARANYYAWHGPAGTPWPEQPGDLRREYLAAADAMLAVADPLLADRELIARAVLADRDEAWQENTRLRTKVDALSLMLRGMARKLSGQRRRTRSAMQWDSENHNKIVTLTRERDEARAEAAALGARLGDMTTRLERILGPARYPLAEVAAEFGVDLDEPPASDLAGLAAREDAAHTTPPRYRTQSCGSQEAHAPHDWVTPLPYGLQRTCRGMVGLEEIFGRPVGSATQDGDTQ